MQQPTLTRKQLGGLMAGGMAALSVGTASAAMSAPPVAAAVPFTGNTAFEILHNDHAAIRHHLEMLASSKQDRKMHLDEVSMLFTVHNATEENFVYPAVGGIAMMPNEAMTLFHQQDEAKTVVWKLHQIGKTEGFESERFTETAQKLLSAALAHVAFEENQEFPKLQSALGAKGLAELNSEVIAFRKHFV